MTKTSRRVRDSCFKRIPFLPFEVQALVVEELGKDRDLLTLRNLQASSSDFCKLARKELYRHVDFRGKSARAVEIFATLIAPLYGRYTLSVTHRPVDEDIIGDLPTTRDQLDQLRRWDRQFSAALCHLTKIRVVDLTVPLLEFHCMYGDTFEIILGWKGIKHLTLRAAGHGTSRFMSSAHAFNARTIGTMLTAFPDLDSFRALGISGGDVSPDGPSIISLRGIPILKLTALHLDGGWLKEFTPHFARLRPPLTHLVLAEDSEIDFADLKLLLLAVAPTIQSLAMRQIGDISDDTTTATPFKATDLPRLKRLAFALEDEIVTPLKKFLFVELHSLEVTTADGNVAGELWKLLEKAGAWPALKELAFVGSINEGDDWETLHQVCAKRRCELVPGTMRELDFPYRV